MTTGTPNDTNTTTTPKTDDTVTPTSATPAPEAPQAETPPQEAPQTDTTPAEAPAKSGGSFFGGLVKTVLIVGAIGAAVWFGSGVLVDQGIVTGEAADAINGAKAAVTGLFGGEAATTPAAPEAAPAAPEGANNG